MKLLKYLVHYNTEKNNTNCFLFFTVLVSFRMQRNQKFQHIDIPDTVIITIGSVRSGIFGKTFESCSIINFIQKLAKNRGLWKFNTFLVNYKYIRIQKIIRLLETTYLCETLNFHTTSNHSFVDEIFYYIFWNRPNKIITGGDHSFEVIFQRSGMVSFY